MHRMLNKIYEFDCEEIQYCFQALVIMKKLMVHSKCFSEE